MATAVLSQKYRARHQAVAGFPLEVALRHKLLGFLTALFPYWERTLYLSHRAQWVSVS